jgi:hypothetical protein
MFVFKDYRNIKILKEVIGILENLERLKNKGYKFSTQDLFISFV